MSAISYFPGALDVLRLKRITAKATGKRGPFKWYFLRFMWRWGEERFSEELIPEEAPVEEDRRRQCWRWRPKRDGEEEEQVTVLIQKKPPLTFNALPRHIQRT